MKSATQALRLRRIAAQESFWRGCIEAQEVARKSYTEDEREAAALALGRPDLVPDRQGLLSITRRGN